MDFEAVRIELAIIAFSALILVLPWSIAHSIYLNRIGSRGMASVKRLLKKTGPLFILVFFGVSCYRNYKPIAMYVGAAFGKTEARYRLGSSYYHGWAFLKPDFPQAARWFRKAADAGSSAAQYDLALMLHYGEGIPSDNKESLNLAIASAVQGNSHAMLLAGKILALSPRAEDQSKALDYFHRALPLLKGLALGKDASACMAIATMYEAGYGVNPDRIESLKWLLIGDRIGLNLNQRLVLEARVNESAPEELIEARRRVVVYYAGEAK